MEIKRYSQADEISLFDMLVEEGEDWSDYHGSTGRDKYIKALESSITYIACDGTLACGYTRCREDVMSDVDPYYEKLGYRRVGSIFEVIGSECE